MSIKGQFLKRGAACEGEPRQPLSPLRRTAPPFAPTQLFELRRCCAWLIKIREHTVLSYLKRSCFRFAARTLRVTSHRNAPSGRSGVAHGLFYEKSIPCSFLQNAHASGSLRSPYGYRGAIRLHSFPWLPLRTKVSRKKGQPLSQPYGLSASPFAPTQLFELRRCCAWLIKIREHTVLSYLKRSCFRFAARTLRVTSHRNAPSGHSGVTVGLFPQRVHSTLCSKTLDLQVRCAHPTGNFAPKCSFGTFRCCAWLI